MGCHEWRWNGLEQGQQAEIVEEAASVWTAYVERVLESVTRVALVK